MRGVFWPRRSNGPRDLSKSDARASGAGAPAAKHHTIAVGEKCPGLPGAQGDGAFTALAQLQQRTRFLRARPGLGAAAKQIARLEIAAVHGVMGDELRDRPVGIAKARV